MLNELGHSKSFSFILFESPFSWNICVVYPGFHDKVCCCLAPPLLIDRSSSLFMVWCLWVHPMIGMLVTFWWIRLSHRIIPVYFKILNLTLYITILDHLVIMWKVQFSGIRKGTRISLFPVSLPNDENGSMSLSSHVSLYFFYNVLSHQVPVWSCCQLTCEHRGKYTSWMLFKDINLASIDN